MFFLAWPWFQLLFEITYNLSNTEKRVPRQGSVFQTCFSDS